MYGHYISTCDVEKKKRKEVEVPCETSGRSERYEKRCRTDTFSPLNIDVQSLSSISSESTILDESRTNTYKNPEKKANNYAFSAMVAKSASSGKILYLEAGKYKTTKSLVWHGIDPERLVAITNDPNDYRMLCDTFIDSEIAPVMRINIVKELIEKTLDEWDVEEDGKISAVYFDFCGSLTMSRMYFLHDLFSRRKDIFDEKPVIAATFCMRKQRGWECISSGDQITQFFFRDHFDKLRGYSSECISQRRKPRTSIYLSFVPIW